MRHHMESAPFSRLALFAALAACAVLALGSCSSLPRYREEMPAEWIEGKDYPIRVSFAEGKKLDALEELRVDYLAPDGARRFILMDGQGVNFTATVPGQDILPGKLAVTVSALRKGKFLKVRKLNVRVLSTAQARQKREAALAARISFSFEEEVPFYRDARIRLSVAQAGKDGSLTFAQRKGGASSFVLDFPAGTAGLWELSVPVSDIREGYGEFYLEYSEADPDLGRIKAYARPGRDAANPFRMRVIERAELSEHVAAELRAAFSFRHDSLASVYYDRDLSAVLDATKGRFLPEILSGEPEARLYCSSGGGAYSEYPLIRRGGKVTARIPAADLGSGVDRYYFVLSADTSELGRIEASLPESGGRGPFALEVLGERESERLIEAELRSALRVKAPSSVRETEEFRVEAEIQAPSGSLFFSKSSLEDIGLELLSSSSGSFTAPQRKRAMRRSGSSYRASIPPEELSSGIDRYSIRLTADTNTPLGSVEFAYPATGGGWAAFDVVTIEELRAAKAKDILSRATVDIQAVMNETGQSETVFALRGLPQGGRAYLYLRRPGDKSYSMREMSRNGDLYLYRMGAKELQSGYRFYYLVLAIDDPDLGAVEAVYPEDGKRSPLDLSSPASKKKGG